MRTEICDRLGIEFPIFAFTHCRDVAAEVSNAGGLGVLGAVGFSPEQLETEMQWLDEHVADDKVYGIDIVIPQRYEGMGEMDPEKLQEMLEEQIPDGHIDFAMKLLADHGVPEMPEGEQSSGLMGWTDATARPLLAAALEHPKVALIANALGTPPADLIEEIHASGRLVAALCGSPKQALQHKEADVDIVIAQGGEGGGHTGDVGSIVLWPQVIDAIAPTPMLAAGGVGNGRQMAAAMAMGAAGIWTGSLWLTVEEADEPPAQMESYLNATSRDTIRSRSFTGKPCRMLRNDWTDAWERPDTPSPLGMPLQMMVAIQSVTRTGRYSELPDAQKVAFNPCGQVIGQFDRVRKTRDVVYELVEEFIEATERLNDLLAKAES